MSEETKAPNAVVIHYHEIALKGRNRPLFIRRLVDNLQTATEGLGVEKITVPWGRIILSLSPGSPWEEMERRLSGVFGVANFSSARRCSRNIEEIEKTAAAAVEGKKISSFRISARRGDKSFPISSSEINRRLGRSIQDRTGARVDLEHPEFTLYVEVLKKEVLIYTEKYRGPGGLPVGISGVVASLLSGGIDSPVASYLMMKRGCTVHFIHFHSYPFVSKASWEKAEELVEDLTRFQFCSSLSLVPFGAIQREIVASAPPPLRVVLYRRFMVRIAEALAGREGAMALVTGESLGQVASQTLENLTTIQEAAHLPILRPLIGFDKEEIIQVARRIGTYPISLQPDEDCCKLFIPSNPSVAARREDVLRAERDLDLSRLIKCAFDQVERREFRFNAVGSNRLFQRTPFPESWKDL